jgi:predicted PurR-regulated permease PerM
MTATVDWIAAIRIAGVAIPRWAAHALGLSFVAGILGSAGAILAYQVADVIDAYPRYRYEFESLLWRARRAVGEENADEARQAFENVDYTGVATYLASGAGTIAAGVALIVLYVGFMMLERQATRSKLHIALHERAVTDEILLLVRSVAASVQNYMVVKTVVSFLTAVFSYAVMKPLGVDFAETWALLAFALNFIPSIGSVLGVIFPAIVSLVQFDTFTPFLVVLFGCGIVQAAIGNVLEPALAGQRLNLSPLAVLLALTFWTAVWGVAGAFLSVPVTVCILIVMAEFPATRPVAIMLSGSGRLTRAGDTPAAVTPTPPGPGAGGPPAHSR